METLRSFQIPDSSRKQSWLGNTPCPNGKSMVLLSTSLVGPNLEACSSQWLMEFMLWGLVMRPQSPRPSRSNLVNSMLWFLEPQGLVHKMRFWESLYLHRLVMFPCKPCIALMVMSLLGDSRPLLMLPKWLFTTLEFKRILLVVPFLMPLLSESSTLQCLQEVN